MLFYFHFTLILLSCRWMCFVALMRYSADWYVIVIFPGRINFFLMVLSNFDSL